MKVPDKFPLGCRFVTDFSGDSWAEFPDGKVFKISGSEGDLTPSGELPANGQPMTERAFLLHLMPSFREPITSADMKDAKQLLDRIAEESRKPKTQDYAVENNTPHTCMTCVVRDDPNL